MWHGLSLKHQFAWQVEQRPAAAIIDQPAEESDSLGSLRLEEESPKVTTISNRPRSADQTTGLQSIVVFCVSGQFPGV